MKFNFIICPKCGKEKITEIIVCGTPCSCGVQLNNDTKENRKEVEHQWRDSAGAFCTSFEDFSKRMDDEKTFWNKNNVFVPFKIVDIPDEILINYISKLKESNNESGRKD